MSFVRLCYQIELTARLQPLSAFSWVCSDQKLMIRYDRVANIPKIAALDTALKMSKADVEKTASPVLSGTEVELHVSGLHHNRTLSGFVSWGQVVMTSGSAILEEATLVRARAISW